MRRFFIVILSFFVALLSMSAEVQFSQIFAPNISTFMVKTTNGRYSPDNLLYTINPDDQLHFSFDELSHTEKGFSYKVLHCNADWTLSALSEFEYLQGFNNMEILDYETSVNTYVEYTHYRFDFPNEAMQPLLSGNYIVQIYETSTPDVVSAQTRICITESLVEIAADVRSDADLDINNRHQQIEFEADASLFRSTNPFNEFTFVIRQNGRTDNEKFNPTPTSLMGDRMLFSHNSACIFEAGNEFRSLDFSNIHIKDFNVEHIFIRDDIFHVEMSNAYKRTQAYSYYKDADGKFTVNLQRNIYEDDIEADYCWVHFFIPTEFPFWNKRTYIAGGFNNYRLTPDNEMLYDSELGGYYKSLLLKQGGYNYLFLQQEPNSTQASCADFEGNFWQTENTYEIFVYYRPIGGRYDRLVGYKIIRSNQ